MHISPPRLLADLCADQEKFAAFINFVDKMTSAVGLDFTAWRKLTEQSGVYSEILAALRPSERAPARIHLLLPTLTQSLESFASATTVFFANHSNYAASPPAAQLPLHSRETALSAISMRNVYEELGAFGLDVGAGSSSVSPNQTTKPLSGLSTTLEMSQSQKRDHSHLEEIVPQERSLALYARLGPERDAAGCIPGIDPPLDQGKKSFCYAYAFAGGCQWPQCNFNHYSQLELSTIPCKFQLYAADGVCIHGEQCVYKHN